MVVLCVLLLLLGGINAVQAFTGRPLVRPERSRRSTQEVRRQSAFAAAEMAGLLVALVAISLDAPAVAALGFLGAAAAFVALLMSRANARRQTPEKDRTRP